MAKQAVILEDLLLEVLKTYRLFLCISKTGGK